MILILSVSSLNAYEFTHIYKPCIKYSELYNSNELRYDGMYNSAPYIYPIPMFYIGIPLDMYWSGDLRESRHNGYMGSWNQVNINLSEVWCKFDYQGWEYKFKYGVDY